MEKFGCVEPFLNENRKLQLQNEDDDKRRLMMKDKLELARHMNLSKMIRQISNDLDQYKANRETIKSEKEDAK